MERCARWLSNSPFPYPNQTEEYENEIHQALRAEHSSFALCRLACRHLHPRKGDGEGREEITDPSEQLSKKHHFNVWEKDTEDE